MNTNKEFSDMQPVDDNSHKIHKVKDPKCVKVLGLEPVEPLEAIKFTYGKHSTKPTRINFSKARGKLFKWEIMFDESMNYDFPDPEDIDEYDWSKLCGITFHPITAKRNSIMAGFRYNDEKGNLQVTFYYHDRKGRAYYGSHKKEGEILDINILVPTTVQIAVDENKRCVLMIDNDGAFLHMNIDEVKARRIVREVNTWFGGTDPAPHKMELYKSKMIVRDINFK